MKYGFELEPATYNTLSQVRRHDLDELKNQWTTHFFATNVVSRMLWMFISTWNMSTLNRRPK